MQELQISKYTAAKIVKDYYHYHYFNKVGVKIKHKIENDHMYMIVNLQIVIDNKKTIENIILTETQISEIIKDHLTIFSCDIQDVNYNSLLHTFSVNYEGNYIDKYKKVLIRKREVI